MLPKKTFAFACAVLLYTSAFSQSPVFIKELSQNEKSAFVDSNADQRLVSVESSLIIEGFKNSSQIELDIELDDQLGPKSFEFQENNIFAPDFKVILSSGRKSQFERGHHFVGRSLDGDLVSISVVKNGIIGLIIDQGITYELEPISNKKSSENLFKLVESKSLPEELRRFCHTDYEQNPHLEGPENSPGKAFNDKSAGPVQVYLECDNKMYNDFSMDESATSNYITALMNVTFTLFSDENVTMQISEIKVWDTVDPYGAADPGTNTVAILDNFRCNLDSYNGRIAHLVSTAPNLGGRADLPSFEN